MVAALALFLLSLLAPAIAQPTDDFALTLYTPSGSPYGQWNFISGAAAPDPNNNLSASIVYQMNAIAPGVSLFIIFSPLNTSAASYLAFPCDSTGTLDTVSTAWNSSSMGFVSLLSSTASGFGQPAVYTASYAPPVVSPAAYSAAYTASPSQSSTPTPTSSLSPYWSPLASAFSITLTSGGGGPGGAVLGTWTFSNSYGDSSFAPPDVSNGWHARIQGLYIFFSSASSSIGTGYPCSATGFIDYSQSIMSGRVQYITLLTGIVYRLTYGPPLSSAFTLSLLHTAGPLASLPYSTWTFNANPGTAPSDQVNGWTAALGRYDSPVCGAQCGVHVIFSNQNGPAAYGYPCAASGALTPSQNGDYWYFSTQYMTLVTFPSLTASIYSVSYNSSITLFSASPSYMPTFVPALPSYAASYAPALPLPSYFVLLLSYASGPMALLPFGNWSFTSSFIYPPFYSYYAPSDAANGWFGTLSVYSSSSTAPLSFNPQMYGPPMSSSSLASLKAFRCDSTGRVDTSQAPWTTAVQFVCLISFNPTLQVTVLRAAYDLTAPSSSPTPSAPPAISTTPSTFVFPAYAPSYTPPPLHLQLCPHASVHYHGTLSLRQVGIQQPVCNRWEWVYCTGDLWPECQLPCARPHAVHCISHSRQAGHWVWLPLRQSGQCGLFSDALESKYSVPEEGWGPYPPLVDDKYSVQGHLLLTVLCRSAFLQLHLPPQPFVCPQLSCSIPLIRLVCITKSEPPGHSSSVYSHLNLHQLPANSARPLAVY